MLLFPRSCPWCNPTYFLVDIEIIPHIHLPPAVRPPLFIFTFLPVLVFCSFFFVGYPSTPPLCDNNVHVMVCLTNFFFSFSSSAT